MMEIDPQLADTVTHVLFVVLALLAGAVIGIFLVED